MDQAVERSIQAEERVLELEKQVSQVQSEIQSKQRMLKEGDDAWSLDKVNLAVQIADLTNKLQGKQEDSIKRQEMLKQQSRENSPELEQQLQELKRTLATAEKALGEERKVAENVRNKLFAAEDNLEFEQMRFEKEKKDLGQRIQQELSKLVNVENQFAQEQERYKQERRRLENRIQEEREKLSQAETRLQRDSKTFNEDQNELNQKLDTQLEKLRTTEKRLNDAQARYKEETDKLRKSVDEEREKLRKTDEQLRREQLEFGNAKKDMEKRIADERQKVSNLSGKLERQTERQDNEKTTLMGQISEQKAKLAEIQVQLEAETMQFENDKERLKQQIVDVERVRNLKSRQMANRFEAIQEEMTSLWQGAKKEGLEEGRVLTGKYEAQLAIVTDNIERLQSSLTDEKLAAADLQQLVDNVAREKKQVLEDQKTREAAFVRQVAQKNFAITGLRTDIESLRTELKNRDEIIEEYETSFGRILSQSVTLTGKRIRQSGTRLRRLVARGKRQGDDNLKK
jgi:chromosome segregation ATPase